MEQSPITCLYNRGVYTQRVVKKLTWYANKYFILNSQIPNLDKMIVYIFKHRAIMRVKTVTLLLFLLILTLKSHAQVPGYVSSNGVVGWWPFNGNANDESGNGRNATSNTASFTQDRNSFQNSAIQLGTGVVLLPQSVFNYNYSSTFSISFWFTHSASGNDRLLSTECPEGNFRIANWGGNGVFATQFGSYIYDTLVNPSQWNHFVFTYNNRNAKVYLN